MRVISELDVYTYKDEAAKNLAVAVSVEFEGPEIDKNVYKSGLLKKGIYYWHYHPENRKSHIFFGKPVFY